MFALALANASVKDRDLAVVERYKTSLDALVSCHKAKAYQFVKETKPIVDPTDPVVITRISERILQDCIAEKTEYIEAGGENVALNFPQGRKKRDAVVAGVRAHMSNLTDRLATLWSKTALNNNGILPPDLNSSPLP